MLANDKLFIFNDFICIFYSLLTQEIPVNVTHRAFDIMYSLRANCDMTACKCLISDMKRRRVMNLLKLVYSLCLSSSYTIQIKFFHRSKILCTKILHFPNCCQHVHLNHNIIISHSTNLKVRLLTECKTKMSTMLYTKTYTLNHFTKLNCIWSFFSPQNVKIKRSYIHFFLLLDAVTKRLPARPQRPPVKRTLNLH